MIFNHNKNKIRTVILLLFVVVVVLVLIQKLSNATNEMDDFFMESVPETVWVSPPMPWDSVGAKQPRDYTWEEFTELTGPQQVMFQRSFGTFEAFEAWIQEAQHQEYLVSLELPWLNGEKTPEEYTWAEFEALTDEQQMAFQSSFDSIEAFNVWLQKAQRNAEKYPWENGGKQPEDYSWAEFEELSAEYQIAFQGSFDSPNDFDDWYENAYHSVIMPWEAGGKQPKDYTWEEFEALTAEQQMAFQNSFDSIEIFDAWLQKAQGSGDSTSIPWENGGKQPDQYTWAEFEALSAELQMIFQNSFENFEEFEAWLERVGP